MAIGYINIAIVGTARGNSVVGLAAYVCRRNAVSQVDGADYRFAHQAGDLGAVDILMPPGAPVDFHDPIAFATALERAELTRPRRKQPIRWKHNAQLAKHVILALPKELTGPERRRLARDWAETQYVAHGAGCVIAHHLPDPVGSDNHHAHIIVSTREVTANGLGNKLRQLNPAFSRGAGHDKANLHKEDVPAAWRQFQEAWFLANGIALQVDPPAAVAGVHLGAAKHAKRPGAFAVKRANDAAKQEAGERLRDPRNLLWEATRQRATFTRRDLSRLLRRHGILGDEASEIAEAALALGETVALFDRETGQPTQLFTTRTIRAQEQRILATARIIAKRRMSAKRTKLIAADLSQRMPTLELGVEQSNALARILAGPDLQVLNGGTSVDKSRLTQAARQCLEAAGYRVIGLVPRNTSACAMAAGGFVHATTVDLELLRQEKPSARSIAWDKRTCLIIDDADMVDATRYEHLLIAAAKAGALVILVGDESRRTSVERGGVFDALKERHGLSGLAELPSQEDDWARAASDAFARGRVAEGVRAYSEHGRLQWSDRLGQAIDDLAAAWARDNRADPGANRFVYATSNDVVDRLNTEIQAARWAGLPTPSTRFKTVRGDGHLLPGDRIQFHAGNAKFEIAAGMAGTVMEAAVNRIRFYTDDARILSFDPRSFKGWGLGYAGTVYRGVGQLHDQVYAIYDDKLAWHARTSQIGFTRHRENLTLFVPRELAADEAALVRQMARADQNRLSLAFADAQEAAKIAKQVAAARIKPGLHPIEVTVRGETRRFELTSKRDRVELINFVHKADVTEFCPIYRKIAQRATAKWAESHDITGLRNMLASTAKTRGLQAFDGQAHPDCLADLRDPTEPLHSDPLLAPRAGEVDIRPLLQNYYRYSMSRHDETRRVLERLDGVALRSIAKSLRDAFAFERIGADEARQYPLILALAELHGWTWRWRERLGFYVVTDKTPRRFLAHLSMFRKVWRNLQGDLDKESMWREHWWNAALTQPAKAKVASIMQAPTVNKTANAPALAASTQAPTTDRPGTRRPDPSVVRILPRPTGTPRELAEDYVNRLRGDLAGIRSPVAPPLLGPVLTPDEAAARSGVLSGANARPVDEQSMGTPGRAPRPTARPRNAPEIEDDLGIDQSPASGSTSSAPPTRPQDDHTR